MQLTWDVSAKTDLGLKRSTNEDSLLAVTYPQGESLTGVFAVADGMGGHQRGDEASQAAIRLIHALFHQKQAYQSYCQSQSLAPQDLRYNLTRYLAAIGREVYRLAHKNILSEDETMGTTLTLAALRSNQLFWAHVGDTRLYLMRSGQLKQLTQDHTLRAQSGGDPTVSSNILIQAIGTHEQLDIDSGQIELLPNDCLLLCSDGLHNSIDAQQILETVTRYSSEQACEQLIAQANRAGGRDNISVIVIKNTHSPVTEPTELGASSLYVPFRFWLWILSVLVLGLVSWFIWRGIAG